MVPSPRDQFCVSSPCCGLSTARRSCDGIPLCRYAHWTNWMCFTAPWQRCAGINWEILAVWLDSPSVLVGRVWHTPRLTFFFSCPRLHCTALLLLLLYACHDIAETCQTLTSHISRLCPCLPPSENTKSEACVDQPGSTGQARPGQIRVPCLLAAAARHLLPLPCPRLCPPGPGSARAAHRPTRAHTCFGGETRGRAKRFRFCYDDAPPVRLYELARTRTHTYVVYVPDWRTDGEEGKKKKKK